MKTFPGYFALSVAALALIFLPVRLAQAASWVTNSPMAAARQSHTATLLLNGKVLVSGGWNGSSSLASAELFDPATGTWTATGTMTTSRYYHTATLLPNGKVLVVGGKAGGTTLSSAELYDPNTGAWTKTGTLNIARYFHTATLLPNGQVLVMGGYNGNVLCSAELYDPATGTWTATNSMNTVRGNHTATLLPNGQVLVAGGWNGDISNIGLASAEIYDPGTGTWTTTNAMNTARQNHSATLLPNGQVLIAGGASNTGATNCAELFNPTNGTWTAIASMTTNRENQTATLLPNGQVLVTGGYKSSSLSSTETYDPITGQWKTNAVLKVARQAHTAVLLANGKLLVAGGYGGNGVISSVGVYDSTINPPTGTNTLTGSMQNPIYAHVATLLPNAKVLVSGGDQSQGVPSLYYKVYDPLSGAWVDLNNSTGHTLPGYVNHSATLLPNGKVLVAGGFVTGVLTNAEIYDPSNGTWGTWTNTGGMKTARDFHTATLLFNGKVLVAGGYNTNSGSLASAELFNPSNGTWTVIGSMTAARAHHTATLLPNGKTLVAGSTNFSELYDPVTGSWTVTGTMITSRWSHTATLLNNGKVLVAGGVDTGTNALSSAELYDPSAGTWTATGSMTTNRLYHTATLLANGKVLVAGGVTNLYPRSDLASEELYDPVTGTWTNAGAMTTARMYHTATLLSNGKVLIAGGFHNGSGPLTSSELYDIGLGYTNSWRPKIASLTSPFSLGNSLVITGAQFRGIAEGSSGNSQDSSADYPLVQLRSVESGQTVFLLSTNWSTNSFASSAVWNFPPGWALATVFVNGIQSTSSIVNISVPVPATTTLNRTVLTNGEFQFGFTNSPGALFGVLATTNLSLPLTNWTKLGGVVEISPGQFQFTDPQATNGGQRYYNIFAP